MKTSDNGLNKIKRWEAFIPYAYDDFDPPARRRKIKLGDAVRGTLTIGYGHTGADVRPGMTITEAQAEEFLRGDVGEAERAIARHVKVTLTQNQYDALVSFVYNVGEGNFKGSTLLKKLNAGKYDDVPGEMMKWVNSKGKKLSGLVNRRSAEAGLWAKESYVQSSGSQPERATPALLNPTNVTAATGVITALGTGFFQGNGPVQIAFAVVLVVATLFGGYVYLKNRRSK
ncbi:MAG TPA: lysozyme [Opitutaceae bacterium]